MFATGTEVKSNTVKLYIIYKYIIFQKPLLNQRSCLGGNMEFFTE